MKRREEEEDEANSEELRQLEDEKIGASAFDDIEGLEDDGDDPSSAVWNWALEGEEGEGADAVPAASAAGEGLTGRRGCWVGCGACTHHHHHHQRAHAHARTRSDPPPPLPPPPPPASSSSEATPLSILGGVSDADLLAHTELSPEQQDVFSVLLDPFTSDDGIDLVGQELPEADGALFTTPGLTQV
jgi:hypothetical protein